MLLYSFTALILTALTAAVNLNFIYTSDLDDLDRRDFEESIRQSLDEAAHIAERVLQATGEDSDIFRRYFPPEDNGETYFNEVMGRPDHGMRKSMLCTTF
jgi:hypothetical protein